LISCKSVKLKNITKQTGNIVQQAFQKHVARAEMFIAFAEIFILADVRWA
jgi:hypothetical protein